MVQKLAIADYVKTVASRINLPASKVKAALEILERNRKTTGG